MNDLEWTNGDDFSLLVLGTTLLRRRWTIARWLIVGAVVAAVPALFKTREYASSAAFVKQGADASRTGLASLAGQFGVAIPGSDLSQSPDFYSALVKSRELLTPITRDTFTVAELQNQRVAFVDLFKIDKQGTQQRREELGVSKLQKDIVGTSVAKTTGVIGISALTPWPSVSLRIVNELIDGINQFNLRTRQGQASSERKFTEGRLAVARDDLQVAEARQVDFLRANRQYAGSPELAVERDRLQRGIMLQQQLVTSLEQSYEEARIREVRDTPVITVVESPAVSSMPVSRNVVFRGLLGAILGALFGAGLALIGALVARKREAGDAEAVEFVGTLFDVKREMLGGVRRLRKQSADR